MSIEKDKYEKLIEEFKKIKEIPQWRKIQNNNTDDKIDYSELEDIDEYDKINELIKEKGEIQNKDYWLRRWIKIKTEQCDRYLFSQSKRVKDNYNKKSKKYDFIVDGVELDLKATRIPKKLLSKDFNGDIKKVYDGKYRKHIKQVLENPEEMLEYLYNNQSEERRYSVHNRLFLIACDARSSKYYFDELRLLFNYDAKERLINLFIENFKKDDLIDLNIYDKKENLEKSVKSGVIFMVKYDTHILLKYLDNEIEIKQS